MRFELYRLIQNFIVPIEAKMVVALLRLIGIESYPTLTSVNIGRPTVIGNNATLSWNCIGWQSFILLLITLVTGLQGSYHYLSKLQAILIGVFGTFLLNILRISFVIVLAYKMNANAALIFHDYFSTLVIVLWLMLYWWFVYNYVLENHES